MDTDVLVVGAGPTGLALALFLKAQGMAFRIIDRDAGPGEASRALAVHARTLEFYAQIGLADEVIAAGIKVDAITIREKAKAVGHFDLTKYARGQSPYPFVLALPQDVHEQILVARLKRDGIEVERNTELTGFTQTTDRVTATLTRNGMGETVQCAWLCGADGAHSAVRHGLGTAFGGGAYDDVFYVADVQGSGGAVDARLDACMTRDGFVIVLPVRQTGSVRLIGIVPREFETEKEIPFDVLRPSIAESTGITIEALNWYSTYRVSHRVAEHFQTGRVFILGDAAHIHSPAGGQGMNTGIGDAVNLAWKLAAVTGKRAGEGILPSYEAERLAFAHWLINSTDRAFRLVATRSAFGSFWRQRIVPLLASVASGIAPLVREAFRTVSQIGIAYRRSPLSSGSAGKIKGGDRLPWIEGPDGGNFRSLRDLDWQVNVYGSASVSLRSLTARSGIVLVEFPWSESAGKAGFARNAAYLVRPDGYIAVADASPAAAGIEAFLSRYGIMPRRHNPA